MCLPIPTLIKVSLQKPLGQRLANHMGQQKSKMKDAKSRGKQTEVMFDMVAIPFHRK